MRHILYPIHRGLTSLLVLVFLSALAFQSQAQSGSVTMTQSFSYTGQIVTYTVPSGVTSLTIEARGAEGGDAVGSNSKAGKGAIIKAQVNVTSGQSLSILVGQNLSGQASGGGGSFVTGPSSTTIPAPLVVAGGGGGASRSTANVETKHGQISQSGGDGAGSDGTAGAGGTNGSGGNSVKASLDMAANKVGSGGGLLGDGMNSDNSNGGGKAFIHGGAGGNNGAANGGFGGGGSGGSFVASGGGGGYSGGGAGYNGPGGGGGSFTTGTRLFARTGATDGNSGNGLVIISYSIQTIRYVKAGGSGRGDGTSWANASGNLQSQINIAGADQVWVAGGIYFPTTGTDKNASFSLKSGVAVYGGFAGGESSITARPPVNPVTGSPSSTTLSGDIGIRGNNADNSYIVLDNENVDATARLDGVVISGGNNTSISRSNFGGAGILNYFSSPTLANCLITQNTVTDLAGAGLSTVSGSPNLINCIISGNSVTGGAFGGGLYNNTSSLTLTNCIISGNTASQGGGLWNVDSSPILTNCLLSNNSAGVGGAIYSDRSNPRLVNCTLTANRAGSGAALRNVSVNAQSSAHPVLTNCILYDNQETANTAINSDNGSGVTANYCLIGHGETDFTGSNNLTATSSPFVSSTDFTLTACSVAINAGDPNSNTATSGATDLAGAPRFYQGGGIDIGAYEFQGSPAQPLAITRQPVSGSSVCAGSTVTAMVSVTGTSPTYQWYKDGQPVTGQSSATLTLTNVQTSQAGNYSVVVTGTCNSLTSSAFSLTVNAPPTVSINPPAVTICAGQSTTLTASGANTYRWSTTPTQTTASISVSVAGPYSVTGTNTATGCSNTATANVTVTPLPNASFTGLPASVCVDAPSSTLMPTTPGGSFSGPGISGNQFSPASATAGGPYSITYTVSNQGCPNASVQPVTVNPLPVAPMIATQSGHSYPGGVSSLTISQNVGNVVLMTSGCMGGTITWAGGGSNTLAVSTFNSGVQTFTATCTSNTTGCTSPKATATVTVVPTTLSVLHRDGNGNINTNTLAPYLQLQNDGNTAIPYSEITVRYWLTVENYAPLLFSINYAQLGSDKVHLKYVPATTGNPTATGYIEFSFDASAGNLGAMSNSGPIQDLINKQDYSYFDQSNDYSYAPVGQFTPNNRITAYRNGVLFYGLEPGPVVPMQSVKAMLQNNTGDGANSIEAVLSVTNDGNVPINYGDIKVRYYFTADNAQPLILNQVGYTALGSGNVSAQIVTISPALAGADRYLELSFSASLGQLAPGASTGGVTYQIRHADYSGFTQTNDYSYQGTGGTMVNPHVVVFVAGQRAYGTEPGTGARLSAESMENPLRVQVLGNPVTGSSVEVVVSGAEGQPLTLHLTDLSGRLVTTRQVERAGATETQRLEVGSASAGMLLLRVSTPTQSQTVKVLRQ